MSTHPPLLLALLSLIVSGSVMAMSPCPASGRVASGDRALVIGIGSYAAGDSLRLSGPAGDRRKMQALLVDDLGYAAEQVCVLADEQATLAGMQTAIQDWLIAQSTPGARVFLYFSGHGDQVSGGGPELFDEDIDQVLAAHDFRKADNQPSGGFLRDDELGRYLEQLADRQVAVVLDSCHSGTAFRSVSNTDLIALQRSSRARYQETPPPPMARSVATRSASANALLISRPGLTVFTAASDNEVAFDEPPGQPTHGHFTHALIEILRAQLATPASSLTLEQTQAQLRQRASTYCAQVPKQQCKSLTPTVHAQSLTASLSAVLLPAGGQARMRPEPVTQADPAPAPPVPVPTPVPAVSHVVPAPTATVELLLLDSFGRPIPNAAGPFPRGRSLRLLVKGRQLPAAPAAYLSVFQQDSSGQRQELPGAQQLRVAISGGQMTQELRLQLTAAGPVELVAIISEQPVPAASRAASTRSIVVEYDDAPGGSTPTLSPAAAHAITQSVPPASTAAGGWGIGQLRLMVEEAR